MFRPISNLIRRDINNASERYDARLSEHYDGAPRNEDIAVRPGYMTRTICSFICGGVAGTFLTVPAIFLIGSLAPSESITVGAQMQTADRVFNVTCSSLVAVCALPPVAYNISVALRGFGIAVQRRRAIEREKMLCRLAR